MLQDVVLWIWTKWTVVTAEMWTIQWWVSHFPYCYIKILNIKMAKSPVVRQRLIAETTAQRQLSLDFVQFPNAIKGYNFVLFSGSNKYILLVNRKFNAIWWAIFGRNILATINDNKTLRLHKDTNFTLPLPLVWW